MTSELTRQSQPGKNALVVSPHVRTKVLGDDTVLLDLLNGEYYTLNATGGLIWERLQQGLQMDAIVAELNAEYGATAKTVEQDVADVVEQLVKRQLLMPTSATTA